MGSFYDDPIFFVPFYPVYADLFLCVENMKSWREARSGCADPGSLCNF